MDANWWNQALESYDVGRAHRADRENAQAYQSGGLPAVADTAGRRGDLPTLTQTRRFQDDERQRAYENMEKVAPWARNVIRSTRNMQPDQARAFLSRPDIRQRFTDFGLNDEQINAGVAGLTDPDPAVRTQWADTLDQGFQQHNDPNWSIRGNRVIGVDPQTGAVSEGGTLPEGTAGRYATPEEVEQAGYAPRTVVWIDANGVPHVPQQPHYESGRATTSELPPGFNLDDQ